MSIAPSSVIQQYRILLDGAHARSFQQYSQQSYFPIYAWNVLVYRQEDSSATDAQPLSMALQAPPTRDEDGSLLIYPSSMVSITSVKSIPDAIATLHNSLTLQAALSQQQQQSSQYPTMTLVGTNEDDNTTTNGYHMVIFGGADVTFVSQLAVACRIGWNASAVHIITTTDNRNLQTELETTCQQLTLKNVNPDEISSSITLLPPATTTNDNEDSTISACNAINTFDILIDLSGSEWTMSDTNDITATTSRTVLSNNNNNDNPVLRQLRIKHGCHVYVSLQSHAQDMVQRKGLLLGPTKASNYINKLVQQDETTMSDNTILWHAPPPDGLGACVQRLLDAGLILDNKAMTSKINSNNKNDTSSATRIQGWSLADYWQSVTWPRDASYANVRFGLPTPPDGMQDDYGDDEDDDVDITKSDRQANPYIFTITNGLEGLDKTVVQPRQTCIIFLTAPFCRTCKILQPRYQRLARILTQEQQQQDPQQRTIQTAISFGQADIAKGDSEKALGKFLQVSSVPSFVAFRNGQVFGHPFPVSKLPSAKLETVIEWLQTGRKWNDNEIQNL